MRRGNFPLWTSERLCKQTLTFRLAGPGPYLAFSSQRRRRGRNGPPALIIFPALQIVGSRRSQSYEFRDRTGKTATPDNNPVKLHRSISNLFYRTSNISYREEREEEEEEDVAKQ